MGPAVAVGVQEAVGEAFVRCSRRPDDDRAGEARLPTGAFTATPRQAHATPTASTSTTLTAWKTNPQQN